MPKLEFSCATPQAKNLEFGESASAIMSAKTPTSSSIRKSVGLHIQINPVQFVFFNQLSQSLQVFLHEWWLIRVQNGSKLGVGGFANREALGSRGMRFFGSASTSKGNLNTNENGIKVFSSATIAKRLTSNNLETVDGIVIMFSGCINRPRTLSHMFSHEVCNRFTSGFPFNWEEYGAKASHEKQANTTKRSLPVSFDDVPFSQVRDILMSTSGKSETRALNSIIIRDILKQCGELAHKQEAVSSLNSAGKIIEAPLINLHEEELGTSKETEDATHTEAQNKGYSTTMSGHKLRRKILRSNN